LPIVRFLGPARDAAGESSTVVAGTTVAEVVAALRDRYDAAFGRVLDASKVWVGGEPAGPDDAVADTDEVAVLPPVSGG
jgi:molybdopterin converting factor small subunit